ncbi:nuclear transport factor 2 family protein [Mycobacterium sp. 21AC1]|uniref:nuclear transport factor 2 family protein n=1 Tax=[Mycobacterium] appelbergii TaxID=2939269 RepID=UPI0029393AC8|nr:nuclear transport factor 2 family protein [Mycobacterium sp. 21AC1]MDV3123479.1 nuclear transport factor 2 family protein [Mycobacterium sp. 21AC1]
MTTIAAALHDLLNERDIPLETAVARHFTDDYQQRTDGELSDRTGFVEHIAHLRSIVEHVDITVNDEFEDGSRYADRHLVRVLKRDGATVTQEVYLFGTRAADGRFSFVDEVTLMLDGDATDREMGRAR